MPFADPTAFSKGQINRAGDEIRTGEPSDDALATVNTWRASHAYVLNTFQAMLRNRTRELDVYVAQRLKRMKTIRSKLKRQDKMDLARMDDVAGCRLIFPNYETLVEFRKTLQAARFSHKIKNDPIDKYNYIARPKKDGYRGIHDIYEYNVKSNKGAPYNGLLLELQYRTLYQHAWATTVEIIGHITENQPKFHTGDQRHVEFFRLASEIISRAFEGQRSCHAKLSDVQVVKRFRRLDKEIRVLQLLRGLNISQRMSVSDKKNVILAIKDGDLQILTYTKGSDALRDYFEMEKTRIGEDIVLVKADTYESIRLSYRNYFSDPDDFLVYIKQGTRLLIQKGREHKRKKSQKNG